MPITQASILKALKNICHQVDKKHSKIKFIQNGKTQKMRCYYDLLKLDANMAGLTKYLLAEINNYKHKHFSNPGTYVPKHQLVHILKSFICADSDKESAQPNHVAPDSLLESGHYNHGPQEITLANKHASQQVPVGSSPEKEDFIKLSLKALRIF